MDFLIITGRYILFLRRVFSNLEHPRIYFPKIIQEINQLGMSSIGFVAFISIFVGAVVTLQVAYNMENPLLPTYLIGLASRDSIILEFSPTMISLVLAGKIGSHIASSLGTMRVTEQIDALESLSLDPIAYLVLPRMLAALVMFPVLTIIANIFGISGGIIAAATSLDVDSYLFLKGLKTWFKPWDAWYGIIKGLSFGVAITSISCYYGYYTERGAAGVGKSTTSTVVVSCIAIMIIDYVLASILL